MAAAAFKAQLIFQSSKRRWGVPCTVSDVADAFYLMPSGASDLQLPSDEGNVVLVDIILSAAGTDTSKGDIYSNDQTTGQQVLNSANVGTVFNRQFMSAPMAFGPGRRIRIKQLA